MIERDSKTRYNLIIFTIHFLLFMCHVQMLRVREKSNIRDYFPKNENVLSNTVVCHKLGLRFLTSG